MSPTTGLLRELLQCMSAKSPKRGAGRIMHDLPALQLRNAVLVFQHHSTIDLQVDLAIIYLG